MNGIGGIEMSGAENKRGLFFYHGSYKAWWLDSGLLSELITGEAVIVDGRE